MATDTPNLPATTEQLEGVTVILPPKPTLETQTLFTSLPQKTEEDRMAIIRCFRKADKTADTLIGKTFAIANVLCHRVQITNEERGEIVDAVRTVLVLEDGTTAAFVSLGVFKSLGQLAFVFGDPPWKPARKVSLQQESIKGKRRMLVLMPGA